MIYGILIEMAKAASKNREGRGSKGEGGGKREGDSNSTAADELICRHIKWPPTKSSAKQIVFIL